MKTLDLHIHSTYSDGTFSVEEIIKSAKSIGLTTISITDHDTVEQIPDCISLGKKYGITVIPGVELSCSYKIKSLNKNKGFHLLGYGINPDNEAFKNEMDDQKAKRLIRAKKIADKFMAFGFKIDFENIITNKKGSVGKPQIAKAKNLIMTAGSDFHSPDKEEAPELACWKDYGLELNPDKRLIQTLN